MTILCVGEVLYDLFPQQELLGGAPLNVAVNLARLGHEVELLSAVGEDARGVRALEAIRSRGLSTAWIQTLSGAPTGTAVVRTHPSGSASFEIERPAAYDVLQCDEALLQRLERLAPSWLYFGTLAQCTPGRMAFLQALRARLPAMRCCYDANLREGHWTLSLVQQLARDTQIMQINEGEARILHHELHGGQAFSLQDFCRSWAEACRTEILCVTLGGQGCALVRQGQWERSAGYAVTVKDTVGAGDAFAAGFLHGVIEGWPMPAAASFANALAALIASHAGAIPDWSPADIARLQAHATPPAAAIAAPAEPHLSTSAQG